VGEVVLSVAHQIKNPLGPMKGYAQMISAEVQHIEPPDRRERMEKGLRIILEESERIDRQVHELLTFAGRRQLRKESVNVNRLLERAVAFVSPETREVAVELALAQDILEVTADPDHLHEAFLNLILNAVEAMAETDNDSVLSLSTKLEEGRVYIQVTDTGGGIAEEDFSQIFEPFFSRKRGGFGLGLAITRSVIQDMNGEIECESEFGEGSVFTIIFPQEEDG
jgi:two-component system nitrogen regulation sensor histidine kinase NtrY